MPFNMLVLFVCFFSQLYTENIENVFQGVIVFTAP